MDFNLNIIIKDKEGHHIIIKVLNLQEEVIIPNVYVPNNKASNCKKYRTEWRN